jgi:hypothetical protein
MSISYESGDNAEASTKHAGEPAGAEAGSEPAGASGSGEPAGGEGVAEPGSEAGEEPGGSDAPAELAGDAPAELAGDAPAELAGDAPAEPASAESAVAAPIAGGAERTPEELAAELARTQAERDVAVATLDKKGRRDRRRGRARRVTVVVLVVLFSILLPVTYIVVWTHYVVLTEKGFQSTVVPIGKDPVVTSAAAATLTDQIFTSLNPQEIVANALPPKADFLAGPITNGAKGYVQDGVTKVLQSPQFQNLWTQAVNFVHSQLLSVLKGNSKAITTTNGQVVLNLVPLFNAALQNMEGFISGVVGHPVTLPTITSNEIPAEACQKIGAALNRQVSSTCGQIPLFPASKLDQARRTVRVFNGILVLLLILTPLLAALALWLSRRRRRTLLQLCAGGLLGLVVIRRVVIWLDSTLTSAGVPANRSARHAIFTHLFHTYFSVSRWILVGLVVVFAVALVTGPYGWARSLRRIVSGYGREARTLAKAAAGRASPDATVTWVRSRLDLLRILGVVVAAVLLMILSVSWIGFLVIAVLLAGYEWWLYGIARSVPLADAGASAGQSGASRPDDQPSVPSEPGPAKV